MNGDISRSPGQPGTLEETLQQMNILIQENRDLKGERGLQVQHLVSVISSDEVIFHNCESI